jgi:hypothetical protein
MPSHATAVATIKYAIVAMYTPRSKFRRKQAAGEGCVSFQIETPPAICRAAGIAPNADELGMEALPTLSR